MKVLQRSRTLRPSTRLPDSTYRVKLQQTEPFDLLELTIHHEKNPCEVIAIFEFPSEILQGMESIYFDAEPIGSNWKLSFRGAFPRAITIG